MNATYLIVGLLVLLALWFWAVYNGLIRFKERTDEAWSDIEVQMKRRYDLIPNLVETVKGYVKHEEGTLTKVIEARNKAMGATTSAEHAQAENMLSGTLKSLFALSEAYPDLKANQGFLDLQHELRDAEDKIQASRRFYNANVRDFNIKIKVFPTNMVAGMLGFKKYDYFDIPDNGPESQAVQVKF